MTEIVKVFTKYDLEKIPQMIHVPVIGEVEAKSLSDTDFNCLDILPMTVRDCNIRRIELGQEGMLFVHYEEVVK